MADGLSQSRVRTGFLRTEVSVANRSATIARTGVAGVRKAQAKTPAALRSPFVMRVVRKLERRNVVVSLYNSLSTAAPPMGNADEPIFFKCAHIEFVRGDSFDRTAVGAKPRCFIFLRWGAANGVA